MMPASRCVIQTTTVPELIIINHNILTRSHRSHRQAKMIYASSKDALKRSLTGVAYELQANDPDDIEYDTVLKAVSKGLAES